MQTENLIILKKEFLHFADNICTLGSYNNILTKVESDEFS